MRNALLLAAALAVALPGPAAAQTPRTGDWVRATVEDRQTPRTAVLLARLMVSEGGWDSEVDHAAVAWSITRWLDILTGARPRMTLDGAILNYAAGFRRPTSLRQLWIAALREDGAHPEGIRVWSRERGRLRSRSDAWKSALERARRHLRGELPNPCQGDQNHWGSSRHPSDRARAELALDAGRWAVVPCPGAMQLYFRTLRRSERRRPRRRPLRVIRGRSGQVVRIVGQR